MSPVKKDSLKRIHADDLAAALIEQTDSDGPAECGIDPESMSDMDLFEWLEVLGYEWNGQSWFLRECKYG
jgi:hypothetical protein